MSKVLKIVLMVCAIVLVLAVSGSMIYYYAFFRPRNERAEWEAELEFEREKLKLQEEIREEEERKEFLKEFGEKQKEASKKEALSNCLDVAYENYEKNRELAFKQYQEDWDYQCEQLGLSP